jgi:hypothetical protein
MSEAIWIELIKALPAFLWIGFGLVALAVAKRLLTQQAPRMTRVETPWVTVELAQQAIEQAAVRGPAPQVAPPPEPDWSPRPRPQPPAQRVPAEDYGAPLPSQGAAPSSGYGRGAGGGSDAAGSTDGRWTSTPEDADEEPLPSEQDTRPASPATPPAGESADDADEQRDRKPPEPMTVPRRPSPQPYRPAYPGATAPPGNNAYHPYYAPSMPAAQTEYAAPAPLPPYAMPSAYQRPPSADTERGLRAATRLALSADLLQGGAILWVDDHHEWNEPLIRLFRTAGITVDTAVSTDEAVRDLANRRYDLVITDMHRDREPDGDTAGIRLLDQMIAVGIPTPAVFFSGPSIAGAPPHPRAVTATNSPEKLVNTVVDIVGTRRSQQAAQTGQSWLDRLRS